MGYVASVCSIIGNGTFYSSSSELKSSIIQVSLLGFLCLRFGRGVKHLSAGKPAANDIDFGFIVLLLQDLFLSFSRGRHLAITDFGERKSLLALLIYIN
jgi:hypothetical protein